jgi:hypothetical protein
VISTKELVARFWKWYEAASRDQRLKFDGVQDFGRAQHVDATSWIVMPPVEGTGGAPWQAYPAGLAAPPTSDRMLSAQTSELLHFLMAAFQSQAYAWEAAGCLQRHDD